MSKFNAGKILNRLRVDYFRRSYIKKWAIFGVTFYDNLTYILL